MTAGNKTNVINVKSSKRKKGKEPLMISPILTPAGARPFTMNKFNPKGGVMKDVARFTIRSTPKNRGSKPSMFAMGTNIGTVINIIPRGSKIQPSTIRISSINPKITKGETGNTLTSRMIISEVPMALTTRMKQ